MNDKVTTEKLDEMRHTAAHVLAAASTNLKQETKLGVGPATEDGFYHDLKVDHNYSEDDLATLQAEMEKIKDKDLPLAHREVSKQEARNLFSHDPYKLELIDEIEEDTVGVSEMGDGFFITLCKGGHVESTGQIGHFKLTRLAGVYWKGDESKPQLQRIYGVLFQTKKELEKHLELLEESKKRDHRKIGHELDLFAFSPLVGPGLPLFTPRGTIIRDELSKFLWELQKKAGYQKTDIPHLAKPELYQTSGHWDKFADSLFHVTGKNKEVFVVKPMNCPHHTQIFASRQRSYRDLPLRYAEITKVYRDEQAGELLGLARVRSITQDDGHVFCTTDQIQDEILSILDIIKSFYSAFDFQLTYHLSRRDSSVPEKYLGTDEMWQNAERALQDSLTNLKLPFKDDIGEAAFYGPKIDMVASDSLKRNWQLATIQLDFNMPERFALEYVDVDGNKQTPVIIHRAITGAFERFIAIMLEHYSGNLPLWLSPTQVIVLPISNEQSEYAQSLLQQLRKADIRSEIDSRGESIGKKIRTAELQKVPVMLIVGKKEVADQTVSIRSHANGDEGAKQLTEIISDMSNKISTRSG